MKICGFTKKILGTVWSHSSSTHEYWLTRFLFLRLLGLVYFFAFLSLAIQILPLIGEHGIFPAKNFLDAVGSQFPSRWDAFTFHPTLFWFHLSDQALVWGAWTGVTLSVVVMIWYANLPLLLVLWALYFSFVNIGQLWYGYGWEIQLLETGFLAMFLVPVVDARPFPKSPPPVPILWLLRWLAFRIYIGAGLIKVRGDQCWRDLTCLYYHYETQPIPNPLSRWLHFFPTWFHKAGVVWNHLVELVAPWFAFGPRSARIISGVVMASFQLFLIASGNLSFLNWLTILPTIACFDDAFLKKWLPTSLIRKAEDASQSARPNPWRTAVSLVVVVLVAYLSIVVIQNLLSPHQAMNTSFDRWNLVNTYGAFGSIGKERYELIIEGTDEPIISDSTVWKAYEFVAKPGDVNRSLPIIAPYQPRIDWQIWFAAMGPPEGAPWVIHVIWKLLHNDPGALSLLANNPFPKNPPAFIRVEYYRYHFVEPWDASSQVWRRERVGAWLPPLAVQTPGLRDFIVKNKWEPFE